MKFQTLISGAIKTHQCPDCGAENFSEETPGNSAYVRCRQCHRWFHWKAITGKYRAGILLDDIDLKKRKGYGR
jgi:transcription elongation factor Elf1